MKKTENDTYRVSFKVEILANREQEYIRRGKKDDFEFESEFEDTDFENANRWISDTTTSFYANNEEEVMKRIAREFHNERIRVVPMIEDGYFYWFDNNCLVEQQRMLHRLKVNIDYACDVEINLDDLLEIANGIA